MLSKLEEDNLVLGDAYIFDCTLKEHPEKMEENEGHLWQICKTR